MPVLWVVGVAAASFLSTNVDNLVMTTAQVAAAKAHKVRRIIYGQVFGSAVLVGVSVVVAVALLSIPTHWIGLLGLVPLALGVRGLLALRRPEGRSATSRWPTAGGSVTSALVTIGNGGDNLAVYIPLFRGVSVPEGLLVVVVFAALDLVLCTLAVRLGRHRSTLRSMERAGIYAVPVLYLAIGVLVLFRSGTIRWIS